MTGLQVLIREELCDSFSFLCAHIDSIIILSAFSGFVANMVNKIVNKLNLTNN